jgi:hypothetical protein
VPVLQHHRSQLEPDHGAAEPGTGVLHHQVTLGVHLRHGAAAAPVAGQYILPIHERHVTFHDRGTPV